MIGVAIGREEMGLIVIGGVGRAGMSVGSSGGEGPDEMLKKARGSAAGFTAAAGLGIFNV